MNIEKYLPRKDKQDNAAMHLQQSKNPFKQQAENNRKIELSIRMLQYINTYNLRRDQILYQCPILKSSLQEPQQFDAEVQCLEEMADIDIVYRNDRKKELAKIRQQEMQALEKIRKEQESKKGFFRGLFSSKSKNKNKSNTLSPLKLKIDQSTLKSSTYIKKMQQDESTMIKSKMTSNQESQQWNTNSQIQKQPSLNSNNVAPVSQSVSPVLSKNKSLGQQQSPIALLDQKKNWKGKQELKVDQLINSSSKKTFSQEQFIQVDEDQLLDADQSKDAHQMSKIIQQKQESQILQSVRQSHVSRISLNDLSENQNKKKQVGRLSKRNRKRIDSEDEDQQRKRKEKQEQMLRKMELTKKQSKSMKKKKSASEAPKIVSKQKEKEGGQERSKKLVEEKKKQKIKKKQQKVKQVQNEDVLSSYISHQISRLSNIEPSSEISKKSSEIYSFLSSADIQSYSDPHQIQSQQSNSNVLFQKQKDKDDSYSDIHIDWLVKIQACELQEKLLMNRIKQRWVQPLKALGKIRDLKIEHLTYETSTDARLIWTKPYLNFGRIIQ